MSSVWLSFGMLEVVIWAGLLPAVYFVCLVVLSLSDPYFDEG